VWGLQSGQEGRNSISSPDQEPCGRQFTETWLVLEYCDKGNLQDAVDRGVFNRHRPDSLDGSVSGGPKTTCNVAAVRWARLHEPHMSVSCLRSQPACCVFAGQPSLLVCLA
jgi:hypothetical protein